MIFSWSSARPIAMSTVWTSMKYFEEKYSTNVKSNLEQFLSEFVFSSIRSFKNPS